MNITGIPEMDEMWSEMKKHYKILEMRKSETLTNKMINTTATQAVGRRRNFETVISSAWMDDTSWERSSLTLTPLAETGTDS